MRPPAWTVLVACLSAGAPALALGWGTTPVDIALGDGIVAHREPVLYPFLQPWTAYSATPGITWRLDGLAPPPVSPSQIHSFARAQGERIVAAVDGGALYTDDRGAHWSRASWDGAQSPRALAFDPASDFGAAVGTNGTVWTTADRGRSWRTRRDVGDAFVDVAVLGHVVAWTSARGLVQVSADGGTSVRTISERARGPMPVMAVYDGLLWIRIDGAQWWRVDREGSPERADRSPWGG
jgi:hypothetical protein